MIRLAVTLLCTLLPLMAWAQSTPAPPSKALLASLKAKAESVDHLTCTFTQEKHLAMFDELLISTGTFAFQKPDKLRWEYLEPFNNGFFLNGTSGREWDDASSKDREFTLDSSPAMAALARQIMAWTTFDIKWLESQYEMVVLQTEPVIFELTPKDEGARQFIPRMIIKFVPDGSALEQIELHEADDDFTRVIFGTPEVNGELPAATFTQVQ